MSTPSANDSDRVASVLEAEISDKEKSQVHEHQHHKGGILQTALKGDAHQAELTYFERKAALINM
jgi:hypothetical protein